MKKFLAVVKREYVQRVRTKFFVIVTVFGPVMMILFTVVPGLIFSMKAGEPTRLAIVDETGKMYERLRDELARNDNEGAEANRSVADPLRVTANSNNRINEAGRMIHGNYEVEEIKRGDQTMAEVELSLDQRVAQKKLDGYLVLPKDLLGGAARNSMCATPLIPLPVNIFRTASAGPCAPSDSAKPGLTKAEYKRCLRGQA